MIYVSWSELRAKINQKCLAYSFVVVRGVLVVYLSDGGITLAAELSESDESDFVANFADKANDPFGASVTWIATDVKALAQNDIVDVVAPTAGRKLIVLRTRLIVTYDAFAAMDNNHVDFFGYRNAPTANWTTSTAYSAGERVKDSGKVWKCAETHTSGATFDETKWAADWFDRQYRNRDDYDAKGADQVEEWNADRIALTWRYEEAPIIVRSTEGGKIKLKAVTAWTGTKAILRIKCASYKDVAPP